MYIKVETVIWMQVQVYFIGHNQILNLISLNLLARYHQDYPKCYKIYICVGIH